MLNFKTQEWSMKETKLLILIIIAFMAINNNIDKFICTRAVNHLKPSQGNNLTKDIWYAWKWQKCNFCVEDINDIIADIL